MYRCEKCGKVFINYITREENNGFSGWDGPTHWETVALSPCCHYDFEEVPIEELTEYEIQKAKEDAYEQQEREEMLAMLEYYNFK